MTQLKKWKTPKIRVIFWEMRPWYEGERVRHAKRPRQSPLKISKTSPTFWADGIVTSNHQGRRTARYMYICLKFSRTANIANHIRNYLTVHPFQSPSQGRALNGLLIYIPRYLSCLKQRFTLVQWTATSRLHVAQGVLHRSKPQRLGNTNEINSLIFLPPVVNL